MCVHRIHNVNNVIYFTRPLMTNELHSIMSWRSIADNFSTIIELIYDTERTIIELTTMKCYRSRLIIQSVLNNRDRKIYGYISSLLYTLLWFSEQ